jgi:phage gpG-like protein
MADKDVKLEFKKLQNFIKYLKKGMPPVKVGILGDTAGRNSGELNNAQIGFTNEFGKMTGYPKIPARSFLRMPLQSIYFKEKLRSKKSLSAKEFEKAIATGKADEFSKKVGMVAEETIQEAFSTNGFGNWKENAAYTIEKKGSSSPLIDTGQLRRSITSKVLKNDNN